MKRLVFTLLAVLMLLPASAMAKDRNRDGIPDRWERAHHLSLRVNQARRDQDGDGLRNLAEFKHGTDPRDADSDDDGVGDGDEVRHGFDPGRDDDGDNGGTVKSFDAATGLLTITQASGDDVSATVDAATKIECESADDDTPAARSSRRGGGGGGADDPADHDAGDDRGGDGSACGTAALVPGAVVKEAELAGSGATATWEKVELVG